MSNKKEQPNVPATVTNGRQTPRLRKSIFLLCMAGLMVIMAAFPAFASEVSGGVDVATTLSSGFETMAETMIKTLMASLPAIMSVLSVYLCIQFGLRFFKKFAK